MSNYTFSKLINFPNGVNISQLQQQIMQSNITSLCLGIHTHGDVIIIAFENQLAQNNLDTLNAIIDTFTPRANVLYSGVKIDTITSANSPYGIGLNSVSCDTSGGNVIINLRKANRSRKGMHAIEKATSDANTVTIIPNGSDLINGSSSVVISTYRECLIIQSDGSNWNLIPSTTSIIQTENETDVNITNNKGDIVVDDGTRQRALNVGPNNQVLVADSTTTLGVKWANPSVFIGGSAITDNHFVSANVETSIPSSQTTFVNINSMSLTATNTNTCPYLVLFNSTCYSSSNSTSIDFSFAVDGSSVSGTVIRLTPETKERSCSVYYKLPSVNFGSIISIQWRISNPPGTAYLSYRSMGILGLGTS